MQDDVTLKIFLGTIPVAVSLLVAIAGYVFTYFHGKRTAERNARFERINLQLRNLYGPLYAELAAGEAMWSAFASRHWPKHGQTGFFTPGFKTTDEEKATWRLWMREVFQPHNEKLESTILANADLLEGDGMPESFVALLAHVGTYKAVLREWADGNFNEHTSVCNFPGQELMSEVRPVYLRLRIKQDELLGMLHRKSNAKEHYEAL